MLERGASKPIVVRRAFRDLIGLHHPSIAVLIEPKISGSRADSVIQSMGFPNWFKEDAQGSSGGIWLLWEKRKNLCFRAATPNREEAWPQIILRVEELRKPWRKTLINKVLGRSVSFSTLLNRTKAIWGIPSSNFSLMDLSEGR